MDKLNIFISFSAGFASFFSPCFLPLIPAYLGSMGAVVFQVGKTTGMPVLKSRALLVTFFFVAGFTTVFVLLGFSAGLVGSLLLEYRGVLCRLGGIIIILFGLNQIGIFKMSLLERSWSFLSRRTFSSGLGASFLLGAIFSLGWSPCIGPVLAGILLLSLSAGSPAAGGFYLMVYSMGMAVPFLVLALFLDKLLERMRGLRRFMPLFQTVSGIFLLILGIMLVSGLSFNVAAFL